VGRGIVFIISKCSIDSIVLSEATASKFVSYPIDLFSLPLCNGNLVNIAKSLFTC
jgi:hypothetical protein